MTGTPFTGRLEPQYPPQEPWGSFDPSIPNTNQVAYDMNHFAPQPPALNQPQRELQWQMVDQRAMRPDYPPGPVLDNTHHSLSHMNTISEPPALVVVQPPETVCYGMISALPATYENRGGQDIPPEIPVKVESDGHFTSAEYEYFGGQLNTDHGQMMYGLLNNDDEPLELFVTCTPSKAEQNVRRGSKRSAVLECTLDVVVYGPSIICDDMGSYFAQHDIYLQDPRACHRDAKYFNPHKLSSTDLSSCPFISEVVFLNPDALVQLSEVDQRPDLLSALSSNADLEETPQPAGITSTLKRHQKQALTFMLRRERGWGFNHSQITPDIWQIVDSTQTRQYLNVISGASRLDEPEEFAGGIVADPMGLGKTLTMISLVATDLERGDCFPSSSRGSTDDKVQIPATLIIVPPPLIGTWEHELTTHVACGAMRGVRHHGKDRIKDLSELEGVNVVLTTYHTVSAESKTDDTRLNSILFFVRWKRIILDEAHFIRNVKSRMAKAVCALDAEARWAVTGTPIQNRLSDFAALLQFIRVHPYDDTRRFDIDIANLWKTGEETQAVERLKLFSQFLLLRRPKDTIDLPARHDLNCPVEFTRDERMVYEKMRMQTITKMDESLNDDSGSYKPGSYMNVLQQIEALRLFCNLGLQFQSRHAQRGTNGLLGETITPDNWSLRAQKAFQAQRDIQTMVCLQCDSALEIAETLLDEDAPKWRTSPAPSCPSHLVSLSCAALDDAPSLGDFSIDEASAGLSSKVQTLISDLKCRPGDEKCIVFSTWRLTLDMVQRGLDEAGISCVRFDGKVPQKDRQPIVDRLTLTVANRAYLMEPHWNPTLEDQALARVHRLGQTKEVTTIRLYIRDSFEEKVMELQESKRSLAGVLLSPHDGGQSDDSNQSELQKLRALL
ncbi:hypothetical protein PG984_002782 [Apiospora sp. TS-2023a]